MSSIRKSIGWAVLLGIAVCGMVAETAQAQFQQGPAINAQAPAGQRMMNMQAGMPANIQLPNPIPPTPGFNPYFPYGATDLFGSPLNGVANTISAQGSLMVSQQQAFLMREQVKNAKIANKRSAFDEYLYEKERTPTAEEERQKMNQGRLNRARNNPPQSEIWSGTALNELLTELRKGQPQNGAGALANPLDEDILKHINITSGKGDGNAGLLRTGGKLPWPDALMDSQYKEERERIAAQVAEAVKQAELNGQVDFGTIKQLNQDTDALTKKLRRNIDDVSPNDYIEAKTFLNNLESSITILKQRDVGNYFSGKYDLKAKNVQELVKYMSDKGLQFTNALPGDESAYLSLYQSMVNYDSALQARNP